MNLISEHLDFVQAQTEDDFTSIMLVDGFLYLDGTTLRSCLNKTIALITSQGRVALNVSMFIEVFHDKIKVYIVRTRDLVEFDAIGKSGLHNLM